MKMKRYQRMLMIMVFAIGIFGMATVSAVHAVPMLRVSITGLPVVTVTDNGLGDTDPTDGIINFTTTGGGFSAVISIGISKPVLPNTPSQASMHLNEVDVGGGAGSVKIELTDIGFALAPVGIGFPFNIVGVIGGLQPVGTTVSLETLYDVGNTEFSGIPVLSQGPFVGPGAGSPVFFGGSTSSQIVSASPFSLTQVANISFSSGSFRTVSFDYDVTVTPTPEPGTLLLLGSGLVALGTWGRRRMRKGMDKA